MPVSPYSKCLLTHNSERYSAFKEISEKVNNNESLLTSEFIVSYFIQNPNLYVYDKDMNYTKFINEICVILAFNWDEDKFTDLLKNNKFKLMVLHAFVWINV